MKSSRMLRQGCRLLQLVAVISIFLFTAACSKAHTSIATPQGAKQIAVDAYTYCVRSVGYRRHNKLRLEGTEAPVVGAAEFSRPLLPSPLMKFVELEALQ
jgi:hypothetical protein